MDTSVIVPWGGDATAGAAGEPAILNDRGRLAALTRGAEEGRLNALDLVAVTVDRLNKTDGVA